MSVLSVSEKLWELISRHIRVVGEPRKNQLSATRCGSYLNHRMRYPDEAADQFSSNSVALAPSYDDFTKCIKYHGFA